MITALGTQAFKAITPQTAVTIDCSRCVRHRCKNNECSKCIDACPTEAISWNEQGLSVSASSCVQCLKCLSVCPTGALKSPELSLPQAFKDLAGHVNPVLGCQHHPSGEVHVRFPCLGCLAHPELMLLLALVFENGLQVNLIHCGNCPNGHILNEVYSAFSSMSEFKPDHKIKLVTGRGDLDCQPVAMSRRELFQFFRNRSSRTAGVMIERLQIESDTQSFGNKQRPLIRRMLIKVLARLPEEQRLQISDQFFGHNSFSSTCTACGGCVGICSTGAIQPAEENSCSPDFIAEHCVSCGSCQAFCLKNGVQQV